VYILSKLLCSICFVLQGIERVPVPNVVKSSEPVIPAEVFVSRRHPQQLTTGSVPTSSLLAVCSRCHLCVHQCELLYWPFIG